MSFKTRILVVNNIKLPVNASLEEAFSVAKRRLSKVLTGSSELTFSVYKRSVDARRRNDVQFVYSVSVQGVFGNLNEHKLKDANITVVDQHNGLGFVHGNEAMSAPPLVVGAGPAGLFAALILAEQGYAPILIERGGSISERRNAVSGFCHKILYPPQEDIRILYLLDSLYHTLYGTP